MLWEGLWPHYTRASGGKERNMEGKSRIFQPELPRQLKTTVPVELQGWIRKMAEHILMEASGLPWGAVLLGPLLNQGEMSRLLGCLGSALRICHFLCPVKKVTDKKETNNHGEIKLLKHAQ